VSYSLVLPSGIRRWRLYTFNAIKQDVDLDQPPRISCFADVWTSGETAVLANAERLLVSILDDLGTHPSNRDRALEGLGEVRRRRDRIAELIELVTEHQNRKEGGNTP
jgi:hypothetical protein